MLFVCRLPSAVCPALAQEGRLLRILVTGSNGLLGQCIARQANGRAEVVGCDLHPMSLMEGIVYRRIDIASAAEVARLLREVRPKCVINTAAITDVDRCERDRALAWRVNVLGVENLLRACEAVHAALIQLSTDYVFDGRNGPYAETDVPYPLGYYGRTKLESEARVRSSAVEGLVVRTMVLYGYAPGVRSNFVTWLLNALSSGERVRIVTDQWGNPTFADDLAILLFRCASKGLTETFHAGGGEFVSRYDMALRVADVFGCDPNLICPIRTEELGQVARRPMKSGLRTGKLEDALDVRMGGLDHGLHRLRSQMIGCRGTG